MVTDNNTRRMQSAVWLAGAAAVLLVCLGLLAVGPLRSHIFGGSQAVDDEARKDAAKKQEKPDYEVDRPVVRPGEPASASQTVKPGHWTTATQRMRANYRDFVGQSLASLVGEDGSVYPVDRTPFLLRSARSVALSKGTPKNIETTFLVPQVDSAIRLATELEERGLGGAIRPGPVGLTRMPSYQYYFVVLAKEPSRYSLLKTLDSVKVPFDGESEMDDTEDALHYRVEQLDASGRVSLSDNPLTWTSIAYVLWDEVDPQLLTPETQRALVDWLHWGGQLIISGPDSLDLLKGSFLDPYLPAASTGSRQIGARQLAELNRGWTISTKRTPGEPLAPLAPWSGLDLKLHADARPLWSTGGLLVERSVGRGRIVVSAMQLSERELVNWRSGFQSLFNACVLRRPPRVYKPGQFGDVTLAWANEALADHRLDARLTTSLRYFARDEGVATSYRWVDVTDTMANQYAYNPTPGQKIRQYQPPAQAGGIGAWNDFSATANAARQSLREAAGVEVPGASFVVTCLVAYLIALVPLNWFIFHTLGRVEWAWAAAPLIALVGAFIVVDQARLDIGFVRSQTEIGLLELQPDYPRGHLARYTALYTSLSTTYDVESDNLTTLVAPFPARDEFQMLRGESREALDFRPYDRVRLAGLPVASNSTNLLHGEQMIALEGPICLGQSSIRRRGQVENRSQFHLRSIGIVRRPAAGERVLPGTKLQGTWIGELRPGQAAPVSLPPLQLAKDQTPFAEQRADEDKFVWERLNLEPMFALAYDAASLDEGETRLVARIDEVLPGETISPAASQVRGATLVVAHLYFAPPPDPRPDKNTRQDVKVDTKQDDE
jgi:hypothetical protein